MKKISLKKNLIKKKNFFLVIFCHQNNVKKMFEKKLKKKILNKIFTKIQKQSFGEI